MQHIIPLFQQHALVVVFLNLLLAQAGLPLPIMPTIMAATVLADHDSYQVIDLALVAVSGALIGDSTLYWCGRHYGRRILGQLCRISFNPDFCVRRTEMMFAKIGPWSLLFAKFIPGVSPVSVAMAGITKMAPPLFLLLDGMGKLLFVSVGIALGLLFKNAVANVLSTLTELGQIGGAVVVAALALYVLGKWWRRRLFIRQLRMDRITVDELRQLIDGGPRLVILDVRPKEVRAQEGIIPHSLAAHPSDTDAALSDYPRDEEIVVYCDCPNEASAAIAARHLKKAGFKKIRPLLGGFEAWVDAGHPLERIAPAEEDLPQPRLAALPR